MKFIAKVTIVSAAIAQLGLSAPALADVCITESFGLYFQSQDDDTGLASTVVVQQCTDNAFTDHAECSNNLQCGQEVELVYPSGTIACEAQAQGLGFQAQGTDINQVTQDVVNQCQAQGSNEDCAANLACSDASEGSTEPQPEPQPPVPQPEPQPQPQPPAPQPPVPQPQPHPQQYMYCTTQSNGRVIRVEGYGENQTLNQVINQCYNTPGTLAPQCIQNARCSTQPIGVYPPAPPAPPYYPPQPPAYYPPRPPVYYPPRPPAYRPPRPPVYQPPRPRPMPYPRPPGYGPRPPGGRPGGGVVVVPGGGPHRPRPPGGRPGGGVVVVPGGGPHRPRPGIPVARPNFPVARPSRPSVPVARPNIPVARPVKQPIAVPRPPK